MQRAFVGARAAVVFGGLQGLHTLGCGLACGGGRHEALAQAAARKTALRDGHEHMIAQLVT